MKSFLLAVFLLIHFLSQAAIPDVNKPWTYWWWMGSAVTRQGISDQLNWMHENGIGGVHIIPIYGEKGDEKNFIPYLSDQWMQMLEYTLEVAEGLNMGVDISLGTGWPFGGPDIDAANAARQLKAKLYEVHSDSLFTFEIEHCEMGAFCDSLLSIKAFRGGEVIDLSPFLKNKKIVYQLPEGEWHIREIYSSFTGMHVKRAAPGGEGYVINYLDRNTLDHYVQRFVDAFDKNPLNSRIRAIYNDSYESFATNWSADFLREFESRRGYKLEPLIDKLYDTNPDNETRRLFQDYQLTASELLYEFTESFVSCGKQFETVTRNQAHGSPANLLDLYALADIPETESFGASVFNIKGVRLDEKYEENRFGRPNITAFKLASSPAHFYGKQLVSAESFTWLGDHFKVALSQVKPHADQLFAGGVNHIFYHGSTYSPMDKPFPGKLFYASTNFNHNSHFGPYFKELNNYITRCQTILQNSAADNDVLVYFSIFELWNDMPDKKALLQMLDVHHIEDWLSKMSFGSLVERLEGEGYTIDYVSDKQLSELSCDKGVLISPGNKYKCIVIPDCVQLPLETLFRLEELAIMGANIIFENRIPRDVPGLFNYRNRQDSIAVVAGNLRKLSNVSVGDVFQILSQTGIYPEPMAAEHLSFLRKKRKEGIFYFVSNPDTVFEKGKVYLNSECRSVEIYYPISRTSEIQNVHADERGYPINLTLYPGESCFIFTNSEPVQIETPVYDKEVTRLNLTENWKLTFLKGEPFIPEPQMLNSLESWTNFGDSAYRYFSGTGEYHTEFYLPRKMTKSKRVEIDLGDVRENAEVFVNGTSVAKLWCYPYRVCVPMELLKEKNTLNIKVRNLSYNRIIYMDKKDPTWKNFYDINFVNIQYKPFDASGDLPQPSGLLGPVVIQSFK